MDRLVEAELLLDGGDQRRIEALGAGVLRFDLGRPGLQPGIGAGDAARGTRVLAGERRNHLVDRTARRELNDEEVDRDDADQRRNQEEKPAQDVATHAGPRLDPSSQSAAWMSIRDAFVASYHQPSGNAGQYLGSGAGMPNLSQCTVRRGPTAYRGI